MPSQQQIDAVVSEMNAIMANPNEASKVRNYFMSSSSFTKDVPAEAKKCTLAETKCFPSKFPDRMTMMFVIPQTH